VCLRWLAGWLVWVYRQIKVTAVTVDNAQPADAIAVFGAAEYAGGPSPVLHARLDKAVSAVQPRHRAGDCDAGRRLG
jgi:hypothetical protein